MEFIIEQYIGLDKKVCAIFVRESSEETGRGDYVLGFASYCKTTDTTICSVSSENGWENIKPTSHGNHVEEFEEFLRTALEDEGFAFTGYMKITPLKDSPPNFDIN